MTIDGLKKEEEIIENEIWKKGKEKNLTKKELIWDGVVSEEKYLDTNNKYKIMWILKNGYDDDLGFKLGTDLLKPEERIKKANGKLIPTLRGMIYITYGLLNDKSFDEMRMHKIDSEMIEVLTKIAWVNISKASGERTSESEYIEKEYDFWKEILFKQIKTYSPDILIFGGTFKFFKNDWPKHFNGSLPDDTYFCQNENDMLIISTYHPSYPFREDARICLKDYVKKIIESVNTAREKK
jgi:hypothetical protein